MQESLEDIEWNKLASFQDKKSKLISKQKVLNTAGVNKSFYDETNIVIELEIDEINREINNALK